MRRIERPPGPRTTTRTLREAHSSALAALDALATEAIRQAGKRPWDLRGRPKKNTDDNLIEDVTWMLRDRTPLDLAAERLGMASSRLRMRLVALGRRDLLARLQRDEEDW